MKMRSLIAAAGVALAGSMAANAAVITMSLVPVVDAGDSTLYHVGVYAKTDTGIDKGIAGLQFDVLSLGNGLSTSIEDVDDPGNVKNAFAGKANGSGFSRVPPQFADASTVAYPTDVDADKDAIGGSFFTTATTATAARNNIGTGASPDLICTIDWRLNNANFPDSLRVFAVGPQYYTGATGTKVNFDSAVFGTATLPPTGSVPEPTSLAVLGLGALAAVRRRRA